MNSDRLKILFAQKYPLFPTDSGAKKRSLNVLQHLAAWHDVTYLCNHLPSDVEHLAKMDEIGLTVESLPWSRPGRASLRFGYQILSNLLSSEPFTVATNTDSALTRRAQALVDQGQFDLVICDTVVMAPHILGLDVRPKILFQHNVEAQIFERHAQTGNFLKRQYMHHQWRKMARYEAAMNPHFDGFIAVSEEDRARFVERYAWENVYAIDTAVDTNYFEPREGAEQSFRVVFLGSMDWMPNQEGVIHFVQEMWPAIRRQVPQAEFQIVGRNPPASVLQLGTEAGVSVLGTVPDVRPYLAEASVVVVPLLVGGGTRIKIFEALAMGKAVVSTTIGAEGLRVTPGEHLAIEDRPEPFAACVSALLNNDEARAQLGDNGRRLVVESFSTERIARQFNDICVEVHEGFKLQQRVDCMA